MNTSVRSLLFRAAALLAGGQTVLAQGTDACTASPVLVGTSSSNILIASTAAAGPHGPMASCRPNASSGSGLANNNRDVWYAYQAGITGVAVIEAASCPWTRGLSFQRFSACGSTTELDCAPNICANAAVVNITAGTTYFIRVGTYGTTSSASSNGQTSATAGLLNITEIASGPPANDSCTNAQVLPSPGTYSAATYFATLDGAAPSCAAANPGTKDVWFQYTASATRTVAFDVSGTTALVMSVNNGNCGGAELACRAAGTANHIEVSATAGQVLLFRLAEGTGSTTASRQVTVAEYPVVNDNCASATPISVGTYTADTRGANTDGSSTCGGTNDIWFSYTPPVNGRSSISLTGTPGLTISALQGTCAGSQVACKVTDSFTPFVFPVLGGQTYLIRIAVPGSVAPYTRQFTLSHTNAPTNDTCENPLAVTGPGTHTFTDAGALSNGPYPTCASPSTTDQYDVWYAYTATLSGNASITANFSSGQTAVFSGTCANPTQLGCSNGRVCFPITANQTYLVRVGRNANTASPNWSLKIEEFEVFGLGETCQTPATVVDGDTFASLSTAAYCDDAQDFGPGMQCLFQNSFFNIWLQYTPLDNGVAVFETLDTATNTLISAYSSCYTPIACNDHFTFDTLSSWGGASYLAVPATQNIPILVRVGIGSSSVATPFALKVRLKPKLPNDECVNALPITPQQNFLFDTRDATDSAEPWPTNCLNPLQDPVFTTPHRDVWYKWTPAQSGTANINTCYQYDSFAIPGILFTALAIYDNSCSPTALLACNDNHNDDPTRPVNCSDDMSNITFNVLGGHTYYFRYAGQRGTHAAAKINLTYTPAPCVADHNHSGTVTVQDIFSFLSAWFAGNTSADANASGTVTVQDIFFFLSRWFAGC